jgi:hypothetical protein
MKWLQAIVAAGCLALAAGQRPLDLRLKALEKQVGELQQRQERHQSAHLLSLRHLALLASQKVAKTTVSKQERPLHEIFVELFTVFQVPIGTILTFVDQSTNVAEDVLRLLHALLSHVSSGVQAIIVQHVDAIFAQLDKLPDEVVSHFTTFANDSPGTIAEVLDLIEMLPEGLLEQILTFIIDHVDEIEHAIKALPQDVLAKVPALLGTLVSNLPEGTLESILPFVDQVLAELPSILNGLCASTKSGADKHTATALSAKQVKEKVMDPALLQVILTFPQDVLSKVIGILPSIPAAVLAKLPDLLSKIPSDLLTKLFDVIATLDDAVLAQLFSLLESIPDAVITKLLDLVETLPAGLFDQLIPLLEQLPSILCN